MPQEIEKILKKYNEEVKKEFSRQTGILLEKFEDQVKIVAEGFEMLSEKMDRMESRLDGVESRLDRIENRLDKIESRLDHIEIDVGIIKTDIEFIKNGLKIKVDLEEFSALERRVAFLEAKIIKNKT